MELGAVANAVGGCVVDLGTHSMKEGRRGRSLWLAPGMRQVDVEVVFGVRAHRRSFAFAFAFAFIVVTMTIFQVVLLVLAIRMETRLCRTMVGLGTSAFSLERSSRSQPSVVAS